MNALQDVRVVTLESGVSAPLCSRLLADLGADVIKVERPNSGDTSRHWDTAVRGNSSAHVWVNRNKRSIELDLKNSEGNDVFHTLASTADVIIQNFSPGTVEELGIDYQSIADDDVIYLNISGFGRDGPFADRKAYDLVMQGETGLIEMTGVPDSRAKIPISICDISAAMYGVVGILAALYQRSIGGGGQDIDVTMFGSTLAWLGYFPLKYWYKDEIPERLGMRHHLLTPYGPFETADNEFINFAVLSESHFEIFCEEVLERPDLLADQRFRSNEKRMENRETFESIVESEILSSPKDLWIKRLDDADLPYGEVNDIESVLSHPQLEHLELIQQFETSEGPIKFINNPIDMGDSDHRRSRMPELGEHTEEILHEIGIDDEGIRELAERGVL